jgi:hypothetical protein
MAVLFVAMIVGSVTALIGFAMFLIFCAFVVVRTGSTAGLRDVAVAVRAFASVWSLASRNRLRSIDSPIPPEPGRTAAGDHDELDGPDRPPVSCSQAGGSCTANGGPASAGPESPAAAAGGR